MSIVLREEFSIVGFRHKRIARPEGALQGMKTVRNGPITFDIFRTGDDLVCRVYHGTTGEHGWYSLTPENAQ